MAAKQTIKKAVCDKCGNQQSTWYRGRQHYEADCSGKYVLTDVPKDVITGEFAFQRSAGNRVYLRHIESGRIVNIFTVDLLKIMAGRPIGSLVLTESKRGDQTCWKATEVTS